MKVIPLQLFDLADTQAGITHEGAGEFLLALGGVDQGVDLLGREAGLRLGLGLGKGGPRQPVIPQQSPPPRPLEHLLGQNHGSFHSLVGVALLLQGASIAIQVILREPAGQPDLCLQAIGIELVQVGPILPLGLGCSILGLHGLEVCTDEIFDSEMGLRNPCDPGLQFLLNLDGLSPGLRPASSAEVSARLFSVEIPILGGIAFGRAILLVPVVYTTADRDIRAVNAFAVCKFHVIHSSVCLSRRRRNGDCIRWLHCSACFIQRNYFPRI
ncbi:MAG TPA: hypothetical protein VLH56_06190 [Dissulfurispiraceae bacterium]|nr:hypothetical protein [Dissulfurispiraceae bacterium]